MSDKQADGEERIDYDALSATVKVPPLGNAARQLLALSDDAGFDARILSVIAQSDPIHLVRILALANASTRGLARPARTADEAIQVIGTRDARAAMLALALAGSFPLTADAAPLRTWLLAHSVNLALTARRVAAFLELPRARATHLLMASLFDPLGVLAALGVSSSMCADLLAALRATVAGASLETAAAWPRNLPLLEGYWRLSATIARRWSAQAQVIDILESRWSPEGGEQDLRDASLLWLIQELLWRRHRATPDITDLLAQPNPLDEHTRARLASGDASELAFARAG